MAGSSTLIVLQEARSFSKGIDELAAGSRGPGAAWAADQIRRAAESVHNNIAEGAGRGVSQSCLNFLKIAYGSLCEVEDQLTYGADISRFSREDVDRLLSHLIRVRYLLIRFRQSVERRLETQRSSLKRNRRAG